MEIKVSTSAIQARDADAIILGVFEGTQLEGATQVVDQVLGGAIGDLIDEGDLSGKLGEVIVLYPRGAVPARRVIVVGWGPKDGFTEEARRRAAAFAMKKVSELKARRVTSALYDMENQHLSDGAETAAGRSQKTVEAAAQAVTEGSLLALYRYRGQKTEDPSEKFPEILELAVDQMEDVPAVERGVQAGQAIAAGVTLTRELVNLPPNVCTPAYLAEVASQVAVAVGNRVRILDREQMAEMGMGALLAVAQGSDTPPRLIVLEHNADRATELDTIVLVGKGVTFDTGGYSLKSREGMGTMKGDMAGAAAVIGAMQAIGALDVPLHVVGLAPASDNMISGHAYRPQEVVTASNGVTIEVISTDAEGRMLLADALVYAERFSPAVVVDIATLTGTCAAALGGVAAGLFSTSEVLRDGLLAASDTTCEKLWPLPLFSEYEKAIESDTADIKNSGGRSGGIGSSAVFLEHFVTCPAWAHIDMAGLAFDAKDNPYVPGKGATGYGVRLLTEFVRRWQR